MLTNYHTHTYRCHHASGTDREYVESAIRSGLKVLGFSDHSPYLFDGDYYSTFRMRPEEAHAYAESVRSLAREYASDITILLGCELEYYPKYFARTLRFLSDFDCDYVIMGQHFSGNEEYYASRIPTERDFIGYVDQLCEGMETGVFTYVCHPDLCICHGNSRIQENGYVKICETAKRLNLPLELNMLGMAESRHYPTESFFSIAREMGNTIVPGCDAHQPERVNNASELKTLDSLANRIGITLTELSAEQVLSRKSLIR